MHHRSQRDEKHPPEHRPPVHHLRTQSVCERENARARARVCGNTRARARAARTQTDEDGRGRGRGKEERPTTFSSSTGHYAIARTPMVLEPYECKTHFFLPQSGLPTVVQYCQCPVRDERDDSTILSERSMFLGRFWGSAGFLSRGQQIRDRQQLEISRRTFVGVVNRKA